jgi:hypothetical protein
MDGWSSQKVLPHALRHWQRAEVGALLIGTLLLHFVGIDPRLHEQIIIYLWYGLGSRSVTLNHHLNT